MAKLITALPLAAAALDPRSGLPLYRQLYESLRAGILDGRLRPGARLPSTRELASTLNVSRNTVMNAFEQLLAEGYLEGHVGSGTFVTRSLPEDTLHARAHGDGHKARATGRDSRQGRGATHALSQRGAELARSPASAAISDGRALPFRPGTPALDKFPFEIWGRLAARHWRKPPPALLGYGEPAGHHPLREAIATYLGTARAVRCEPSQVIVTAGAQQALDLAARVLLDPGDPVWIEDPGYLGARVALRGAGARLVPVPVDEEGLDVSAAESLAPRARMCYVSPSHQYPLGVTMSLARRLQLLEWAAREGAWVLEDDYDSEYRYAGRPLAAMQGLDRGGRVIYLGTFSKVLFPALRLGYMVVPPDLASAFSNARGVLSRFSPTVDQAVLADFIHEGHFARHIRRTRSLYATRQAALVEAVRKEMSGLLEVEPDEAGIHLVGWLAEGADDRAASLAAERAGIDAQPLSSYTLEHRRRGGLVLGYAGYDERRIREGVRRLAAVLRARP
ncbi:MAG TPA: PLP-dependent aminotransferase family protein [Pyrinomonadaceae bacterium]|jgi:GntR family transcriptional regulator/MocR family aminotransferase|nr:PLP-dependent aminotransferase family protein [Pyrinomonadaceae bacterium]